VARDQAQATFLSSYHWTSDTKGFGGYSAIVLSRDGSEFTMMSDRANLVEGKILRHLGRIIGVRSAAMVPLGFPDHLFEGEPVRDTEGLARDMAGRLYVSVESENRIMRRDTDGSWSLLPSHAPIDALPDNRGLEALTLAPDGALYAIPEVSDGLQHPFPVYRYRSFQGWDQPKSLTRSDGYLPVGADVGPDGRLYVLERGFGGFGFYSRVRRFVLSSGGTTDGETVLTSKTRRHDNLEGLSVWQAEDGTLRLTMVSDDNYNFFQKTEIVEYAIGN
jgi:hypothetical protein